MKRGSGPPTFLSWLNGADALHVLLLTILLPGASAAQRGFSLATNGSVIEPYTIKQNFVSLEKLRVRYIESGTGPVIVMIHGNARNLEIFR